MTGQRQLLFLQTIDTYPLTTSKESVPPKMMCGGDNINSPTRLSTHHPKDLLRQDLVVKPGLEHFIPVGHSDYGLAMPAVNSAISLSIISTYFFNSIPYGDGLVFIQTIQKWTEVIRKYYSEIETSCFDASGKHS